MHGIQRVTDAGKRSRARYARVCWITIHYSDGRELQFVPDAGAELFDEDDMLKLSELLAKTSQIREWAEVTERRAT